MLQYSIYSVISPEGCASILWKSAEKAGEAARAMGVTAEKIAKLGLIDAVIREPLGGAHRDAIKMSESLKQEWVESLKKLKHIPVNELVELRYKRWMSFGVMQNKSK
jgi:acetyl-CoA carboxylase carboxyl transferase subunit alpha